MRKSVLSAVLFFAVALPLCLCGDARYFRGGGKEQIFYTRGDTIYRYPEGDPLYRIDKSCVCRCGNSRLIYRFEKDCLVRVSDGRRLYILRDGKVIRCTDGKDLYRFDGELVRRVSDGKAVLRREGDDPLLAFFMVLMLADM